MRLGPLLIPVRDAQRITAHSRPRPQGVDVNVESKRPTPSALHN